MKSFEIQNPTKILFGTDKLQVFAKECKKLGSKILIITGKSSVKKLGYLDLICGALKEVGIETMVFEGIEPNPQAKTCNRAAEVGKDFGAECVLALGGGSSMDAGKAVAALLKNNENDIWQFVLGQPRRGELTGALPIIAIPTTAATASEVTPFSVISNEAENEKSTLAYDFFKPILAWLNPAFTTELSPITTQDGAADILSHVLENYLLGGDHSKIADGYSEVVIRTVLETLPLALKDPKNLNHRGDLLWASTLALNTYQIAGREPSEFVLHAMEHSLSAFNSELAHGRGLATLYPAYFKWLILNERAIERLALLGRRVFGIEEQNTYFAATLFVERFEGWLKQNSLYQSIEAVGIPSSKYESIASYCVKVYGSASGGKNLKALGPINTKDIVEIFSMTAVQK